GGWGRRRRRCDESCQPGGTNRRVHRAADEDAAAAGACSAAYSLQPEGAVLHARDRGDVLAARRRVCPVTPSRSSGHAALLLADDCLLRRARVLVYGQAESAGLDVL